jgi:hypothetical protein
MILKQLQEMRTKIGVPKTPALSHYVLEVKDYEERQAATLAPPAAGGAEVRRGGEQSLSGVGNAFGKQWLDSKIIKTDRGPA